MSRKSLWLSYFLEIPSDTVGFVTRNEREALVNAAGNKSTIGNYRKKNQKASILQKECAVVLKGRSKSFILKNFRMEAIPQRESTVGFKKASDILFWLLGMNSSWP